jgi:hypothetical protein
LRLWRRRRPRRWRRHRCCSLRLVAAPPAWRSSARVQQRAMRLLQRQTETTRLRQRQTTTTRLRQRQTARALSKDHPRQRHTQRARRRRRRGVCLDALSHVVYSRREAPPHAFTLAPRPAAGGWCVGFLPNDWTSPPRGWCLLAQPPSCLSHTQPDPRVTLRRCATRGAAATDTAGRARAEVTRARLEPTGASAAAATVNAASALCLFQKPPASSNPALHATVAGFTFRSEMCPQPGAMTRT